MYKRSGTFLLLLAVIIFSCKDKKYSDPLTPEEAIKAFQLNEDFDIEIFAAEPFIKDPVAMAFDDEGNAFVVELPDYPYQPEPGKGKGVIKMLLDIDKDGRADSSIIFAENLQMATSILPWKGGLLVTAAPDIIFMKDTTGDYKADIKEKLFTGFFKDNMEAQITGLLYNIDNWVYAANYGREGEVTGKGNTGLRDTLSMSGADFRFRLDKDLYEQETGVAQFGQTIDEWGHRFLTENSVHINQPVIPWRYLYRHKYLPSAKASIDISDHGQIMNQVTDAPFWRAERTRRRNKTYKEQKLDRIEYADDHFTGASGGVVYNGGIFPDKYDGNFFVTDVAGNLVHRDILLYSDSSPHFIAKLAQTEKNKEFLVSTDPWFRPVGFSIGADGCLYIIDMYRQHIETPFAIPEDLKKDMDFMNGSEYGRIYRIVPKNKKIENGHSYNFKKMASLELVKLLSHTNQQNRLRAQRILVERQDKSVIPEVKRMFIESTNPSYRLHAFYLLEALEGLDASIVKQAIKDTHPEIRVAGIKLGEKYPECLPLILESCNDSSIQVVFQAVLSTGNFEYKQSANVLAVVMKKYGYNVFFRTAILSSEAGASIDFFEMLIKDGWFTPGKKQGQSEYLDIFSQLLSLRNQRNELLKFLKLLEGGQISKEKNYVATALNGMAEVYKDSENKPKVDAEVKIEIEKMLIQNPEEKTKQSIRDLIKIISE